MNGSTRHNRRLAQWRVTWLIEHSTSHQLLWCIDSFVLRNPPLRQAPNRYKQAKKKDTDSITMKFLLHKNKKNRNAICKTAHPAKPHKPLLEAIFAGRSVFLPAHKKIH